MDSLHIHVDTTDDLALLFRQIGIEGVKEVHPQHVPAEQVDVCPMSAPSGIIDFIEYGQLVQR